jgi:16S rRNA (cytosine1407-C5)-methyltransferase
MYKYMGKGGKNNQSSGIPELFSERLKQMVGDSLYNRIKSTFIERPTTFRVNTLKATKLEVREGLFSLGFKMKDVPWIKDAFILQNKSKRELSETEIYKNGKIYVQSLASMAPPVVLDPQPGEKVLDLTAAPGSKTSQMAAMMKGVGELVANDLNEVRFLKLKHNMELLGVADTRPDWIFTLHMEHGADLVNKYPDYFDKILVDAPCSAEARFVNGERETYGFWKEDKIKDMAYKQRQLLLSVWSALKPGGTLVYSTCTFAPEENEAQVSRLLERFPEAEVEAVQIEGLQSLPILKTWKEKPFHVNVKKTLRILPTNEIEGFYIAKIKKKK